MTTRTRTQPTEDEAPAKDTAEQPTEEQAPPCGKPHYLPVLAHVTCQLPPQDPDVKPGTPDHQHRHQDGDALYEWH